MVKDLDVIDKLTINCWAEKNIIENIKLAVQINGKTRYIISIKKDLIEEDIYKKIINESKAKKYIENKKIEKTIFVKDKVINYIISK